MSAEQERTLWRPLYNRRTVGDWPAVWSHCLDLDVRGTAADVEAAVLQQSGAEWRLPSELRPAQLRVRLRRVPLWVMPDLLMVAFGLPVSDLNDGWLYDGSSLPTGELRGLLLALPLEHRRLLAPLHRDPAGDRGAALWQSLTVAHRTTLAAGGAVAGEDLSTGERRAAQASLACAELWNSALIAEESAETRVDRAAVLWEYRSDFARLTYLRTPHATGTVLVGQLKPEEGVLFNHAHVGYSHGAETDWRRDAATAPLAPRRRGSPPRAIGPTANHQERP